MGISLVFDPTKPGGGVGAGGGKKEEKPQGLSFW